MSELEKSMQAILSGNNSVVGFEVIALAKVLQAIELLHSSGFDKEANEVLNIFKTAKSLMLTMLDMQDPMTNLVYVPDLYKKLQDDLSVAEFHSRLFSAYREGMIELRPEGGFDRLSDEDKKLCPKGAGGLPLSFIRVLMEDGV